jgi:hypothetical protein
LAKENISEDGMKLIGRGWQYKVYDLGNDRVLKVERSFIQHYAFGLWEWIVDSGRKNSLASIGSRMRRLHLMNRAGVRYIKQIQKCLDKRLLGNPTFLEGSNYEQDRVKILADLVPNLSVNDLKKIVDDYTDLILKTWQYGFCDGTFNWDSNNGVNRRGELVQVDFGEIIFSKEMVEDMIRNKEWIGCAGDLALRNKELKEYYRSAMDDRVSLSNLHALWGTKLVANRE